MTDTNQKQLGKTLWGIADQLRGAMDADDFRDYMLSFLFLRYLAVFGKAYLQSRRPQIHEDPVSERSLPMISEHVDWALLAAFVFLVAGFLHGILTGYCLILFVEVTEAQYLMAHTAIYGAFQLLSRVKTKQSGRLRLRSLLRRGLSLFLFPLPLVVWWFTNWWVCFVSWLLFFAGSWLGISAYRLFRKDEFDFADGYMRTHGLRLP